MPIQPRPPLSGLGTALSARISGAWCPACAWKLQIGINLQLKTLGIPAQQNANPAPPAAERIGDGAEREDFWRLVPCLRLEAADRNKPAAQNPRHSRSTECQSSPARR